MTLQCQQAVAPRLGHQLVHGLEQLFIGLLLEGRPLNRLQNALDQIDQDLFGRHDDQRPHRGAANRDNFGRVDQRVELPTGHHEAAEDRSNHNQKSNNDNHGSIAQGERYRVSATRKCSSRLPPVGELRGSLPSPIYPFFGESGCLHPPFSTSPSQREGEAAARFRFQPSHAGCFPRRDPSGMLANTGL